MTWESSDEAARRTRVRERKLRREASARGLLARLQYRGPSLLPSSTWDEIAAACVAARKKRGPPFGRSRRAAPGVELLVDAAARLRVAISSLWGRAQTAGHATNRGLPCATWTALAKGLSRGASTCARASSAAPRDRRKVGA